MFLIALVVIYTIKCLVDLSDDYHRNNQSVSGKSKADLEKKVSIDLIFEYYLGRTGKNVYNVFLIVLLLGFCVAYMIFFVDLIKIIVGIEDTSIGITWHLINNIYIRIRNQGAGDS